MLDGGLEAVQAGEPAIGQTQVRHLEKRLRELERLLGRYGKADGSRLLIRVDEEQCS
jgi:hypothetical protein